MLDIDPGKLLIIGIVALVVIPPKDLPSVMRQVGQAVGKLRRMAAEFQSQFMSAVHEAELDEIRKNVASIADSAKFNVDFDPVTSVRNEITGALGEGAIAAPPTEASVAGANIANVESAPAAIGAVPVAEGVSAEGNEAAAGIAPLVPGEGGEAAAVSAPTAAQNIATVPMSQRALAEAEVVAQEADARRS